MQKQCGDVEPSREAGGGGRAGSRVDIQRRKPGTQESTNLIHRTFKLRRVTAAAVLGLGMTAGVIGVTAGTAGATTPTSTATVHATTSKSILSTDTAQPAGNFYVTLPGLKTYTACKLTVTAVAPSGTLTWKTHPTVTLIKTGVTTATHPTAATATHVLTITVPTIAATVTNVKFTVSANTYTITGSKPGPVKINPALGTCTTATNDVAATGFAGHTTVHNATVVSPTTGNSIKASSAPKIASTGTNQAAGSLALTIRNDTGATIAKTTSYIDLTAHPTTSGDIGWNSAALTSSGVTVTNATTLPTLASTTAVMKIELTSALTAGATATITLKTVSYNTVTAKGTVKVTPVWTTSVGTATYGAFTPTSAVNAVATVATPPSAPATVVEATSTPNLALTATGQKAGTWTVTLGGTASAKTKGWAKTESIAITVAKHNDNNCTTATSGYVVFTGTPTAKVSASTGASVAPTFTVSTTHGAECTGLNKSELVITFTNTGKFTKATGSATIVVSGIKYDTKAGTAATVGNVSVDYSFRAAGVTTAPATPETTLSATADGAANASFPLAFVTANTPPVSVNPSAFDASISPVNVVEQATAQIPSGDYVCVSLVQTGAVNRFNVAATPKASVTSGNGTVASTVAYENATGGTSTVTSSTVAYVRFQVTKASSTTKPSTYSLSGLAVNPSGKAGTVTVLVKYGPSTKCTADANEVGGSTATAEAVAYSIKQTSTQIYGSTADATAVKLLENRFPATTTLSTGTDCPGGHANSANTRPVILATTAHYQDALSSQYLASYLNTGTLLTPTAKLSAVTLQALKFEGITQVDVVGGPLVVSTTVIAQLMTTPAYSCGGGSKLTTGGATRFLTVTRIYGQTAVDTAEAIAESAPTSHVLAAKFLTAYVGVNATKGNGAFNDTAGSGSPVPLTSSAVPTAILASTTEFQDAMAASTLSYSQTAGKSFPILLTNPLGLSAAAKDAIATLGIKQVILMGGQLAVTNSVVTSLTTLGVEVLRVAGHTYTDTSTQLAMFEESAPGMGLDWDTTTVAVARGNGFTDGLVGADVSGKSLWPELLTTSPTTVGKYLTAFLKAHGGSGKAIDSTPAEATQKISTLEIFGGPLAVSPAVVSQMETDIS